MKTQILSFLLLFSFTVGATENVRTSVTSLAETNRDFVYELKTPIFKKVILDCASFITGLTFYEDKKILYNFYLDDENCQRMYDFITDTLKDQEVPCFEIDGTTGGLNVYVNPECH